LKKNQGLALYRAHDGNRVVVSFGTRDADLPGLCPSMLGDGSELEVFVSPRPTPASMRSPLMDWDGGPPQIKAPPRSPSVTSYPEVLMSGRTSSHPRGNAEYITPLLPSSREPAQPVEIQPPSEPLSEGAKWWVDQLRSRTTRPG
jgi:hypothetical protein